MRAFKKFMVFMIFVLLASGFIFSEDLKVRVTASEAKIHLKPNTQSSIVSTIPLGAVLEVIKQENEWYLVKMSPDEKGIVVTGYIQQNSVEVIEKIEQRNRIQELKRNPLSEKERYLVNSDSYYPTWKRKLELAQKEKKGTTKWIWIGAAGMAVGYIAAPILGAVSSSAAGGPTRKNAGNTILAIGMGIGVAGTATLIYGLILRHGKAGKIAKILEEGMIKGYIGTSLNPLEKSYSITFTLEF